MMIEENSDDKPYFVFFSQKETIHYSEPLDQIQLKVSQQLENNPNDAQLIYKYHIMENESLNIYKKVLNLDPQNVDARLDIALIQLKRKNSSNQDKLQEIIDECYELDSNYWRIYYTQSLKYLYESKPTKAKNEIQIAYQMFPKEPWVITFLAQQMSEYKQNFQKVEQLLHEVILKYKLDFEVILRISYSYGSIEKPELSEKYLLKALYLNPNSSKANNNLGYYYRCIKKDDELCIKHCTRSLELDPNNEDSYYNLSVCNGKKENFDESVKNLQNCLKINNNYTYALQDLAYNTYSHTKQLEYTDLVLKKLIKKHPHNQYGLYFYSYLQNYNKPTNIPSDTEEIEIIQFSLLNNIYTKSSKYNFISYDRLSKLLNKQYLNNNIEDN